MHPGMEDEDTQQIRVYTDTAELYKCPANLQGHQNVTWLLKKSSNFHVCEQHKSGVSFIMQTLSLQAFKNLGNPSGPPMLNIIWSLQGKILKHCSVRSTAAVPWSLRQLQIRKKGDIFYSIWVINHWCKRQREGLEWRMFEMKSFQKTCLDKT